MEGPSYPSVGSVDLTADIDILYIGGCDSVRTDSYGENIWHCTRPDGHADPHVAGTGTTIVAVWDDDGYYDEGDA